MYKIMQIFVVLALLAAVSAKSLRFDSDADVNEQESTNLLDSPPGLSNSQLDILAQRLAADYNSPMNQMLQLPPAWQRLYLRPQEMKRQNRRYCYFNPVSCFKK